MTLNDDGYKDLGSFQLFFTYSPKERWVGIRNWRHATNVDERYKERTGKKQLYLLQLIPCLGIAFEVTRWTSTRKGGKKKK